MLLFVAWGVVGFVTSFGLLYGFTPIGPLFLALGWLAFTYMPTVSGSRRPEAFGALAGFGFFWLFIATGVQGELPFADRNILSGSGRARLRGGWSGALCQWRLLEPVAHHR